MTAMTQITDVTYNSALFECGFKEAARSPGDELLHFFLSNNRICGFFLTGQQRFRQYRVYDLA